MKKAHLDIGVAMIVKNSAQHITFALQSVRTFARQIVVVDTGSDDSTPEICVAFGAELHFHRWRDNFSEARNYALSAMRTTWILQLDSDEELLTDTISSVDYIISDTTAGGATVTIINVLADNTQSRHSFTRLFRKHPEIRYSGAIHEQIAPSVIQAGFAIRNSQLAIRHVGYSIHTTDRSQRNISLIQQELADSPNDVWLKYHLAMTLFSDKKYAETLEICDDIMYSKELNIEQYEYTRLRAAQSAIALDLYSPAEQYLNFSSSTADREGLRQYLHALVLGISKKYNLASQMLDTEIIRNSLLVNQVEAQKFCKIFSLM
jgi:glycosyltransferase involved in cell wall biosynthesis